MYYYDNKPVNVMVKLVTMSDLFAPTVYGPLMERHMMYNPRQCIVVQRRNYDADLYKKQL
jgi:hypothetical protein